MGESISKNAQQARGLTAEQKVKAIFPEATIKNSWVYPRSKWKWESGNPRRHAIYTLGVWVGTTCYAYGGKYEFRIWRRAYKEIQKEMLNVLER